MPRLAVLPGDGIGREIMDALDPLFARLEEKSGQTFERQEGLIGGAAIDTVGSPLPEETVQLCRSADAVLLGAVGGPKWDRMPTDTRPEAGLLGIRKALGLYANLRPAKLFPALASASTLKPEVISGLDLMVVRELTGGLYFGQPRGRSVKDGQRQAVDTLFYTEEEVRRVVKTAFDLARVRRKHVTSIDKANVLNSSQLWREVAEEVAADYPDVKLDHQLVDNAAMQLVRNPRQYDVIVTENMFGDILSDEAAQLTGSLGMLPSASLGGEIGLYEPAHGSAPDIAGKDIANPLATILSVAMMLRYSFNLLELADQLEAAVDQVLAEGYRTADIAQAGQGGQVVGTKAMVQLVVERW